MSLSMNESYSFDEFVLNRFRRTLLRAGEPVSLSPKAFEVLLYLVANPGRVITKDELLKAVWPESFVEEGNLAQHISWLRKGLGDRASCVVTIPGRGYQFTAPVRATRELQEESSETIFPDPHSGNTLVQRVRERTHVVVEESSPMPVAVPLAQPRMAVRTIGVATALLIAITAAGTLGWKVFSPPPKFQKIMIADFMNLTGDPSMDHTLSTAITIGLQQTPYIQLMASGQKHVALKLMQKAPDTPLLGDVALEVCRRNNFQALLRGKIETATPGYNLTLDEVGCVSGKVIAVLKANASNKDTILDTLDTLSSRARKQLGEPNRTIEQFQVPITDASTFSFEALNDFNIGSTLGNEGKLQECIPYFQKAVDLDPRFAMANASLGTAFYNLGSWDKATEYYKKAFDLSGNVTQWEKLFIRSNYFLVEDRDLYAAAKTFEEWTRTYPNDETSWGALDNADSQIGNYAEAIAAGEHGLQIGIYRPQIDYEILADSYKEANRFADAKRIIAAAQAQAKDSPRMHQILYEIAMVENDPETLQRELAWSKDKPQHYQMLEYQGYLAADEGKIRAAEDFFSKAVLEARHDVAGDFYTRVLFDYAELEAQLKRATRAKDLMKQVKDQSGAAPAVILVSAGNIAAGDAYLRKPEEYPKDTIEHTLRLPELKAFVALGHKDPDAALVALEPATAIEVTRPDVVMVHGEAYLAAHQPQKAAEEFKKIITNPGVQSPMTPVTVIAHLGLARAYAMANDIAGSRAEYEKLFTLWQDADTDFPLLKQAHTEYTQLTGSNFKHS